MREAHREFGLDHMTRMLIAVEVHLYHLDVVLFSVALAIKQQDLARTSFVTDQSVPCFHGQRNGLFFFQVSIKVNGFPDFLASLKFVPVTNEKNAFFSKG